MKVKVIIISMCLLGLCACQSKVVLQEVEPFHHVYCFRNTTKLKVVLSQDSIYQYEMSGRGIDSANVFVRNDTLFCHFWKVNKRKTTIHITAPKYHTINTFLADCIVTTDTIVTDSLFLDATLKNGNIDMQLKVDKLVADFKGKGKVTFSGQCKEARIRSYYKLKMDALELWAEDVYFPILSLSKVKINVSKHLWIDEAILSTIEYSGSPEIMHAKMLHSTLKNPAFMFPSSRSPYIDE